MLLLSFVFVTYEIVPLHRLCRSLAFKSSSNCSFEPQHAFCINACNKRGKCVAGVCLCEAGATGPWWKT